jgi:hypothetical protein
LGRRVGGRFCSWLVVGFVTCITTTRKRDHDALCELNNLKGILCIRARAEKQWRKGSAVRGREGWRGGASAGRRAGTRGGWARGLTAGQSLGCLQAGWPRARQ